MNTDELKVRKPTYTYIEQNGQSRFAMICLQVWRQVLVSDQTLSNSTTMPEYHWVWILEAESCLPAPGTNNDNNSPYIAPITTVPAHSGSGGYTSQELSEHYENCLEFKSILPLNTSQYNFIRKNKYVTVVQELLEFLNINSFSQPNRQFVISAINQMMQYPDLFKSFRPFVIEKNINDLSLDNCSKSLLNTLKNTTNNDISTVIQKFGSVPYNYNLLITTATPLITPSNIGETDWLRDNNDVALTGNYQININPSFVNSASQIAIARVLLHEILHAYLLTYVDSYFPGNIINPTDFPILYRTFVRNTYNNNPNRTHHEQLASRFVAPMRDALQQLDNFSQPAQYYEDLAWGGLIGTSTFDSFHPLGSASRRRIEAVNLAEDTLTPVVIGNVTITPKSMPCQN